MCTAPAAISPETAAQIIKLLNQINATARELAGPVCELNRDSVLPPSALVFLGGIQNNVECLARTFARARAEGAVA